MRTRLACSFAALLICLLSAAGAQTADPGSVKPAWQFEQDFAANPPPSQPGLSLFFVGYDYPTLSGPLAPSLADWVSPYNLSLGFEGVMSPGSSMLTGLELELLMTMNDGGSRFLMNDMLIVGYSFDLSPLRLNLGGRAGLAMLDVLDYSDSSNTYTGLGALVGPEASAYVALGPDLWIWVRGRYLFEYFVSIDGPSNNPIALGKDSLNCLSIEAGIGFKL